MVGRAGSATISASGSGVAGSATVTAPVAKVASVVYGSSGSRTLITVAVVRADTGAAVANAQVALRLVRSGVVYATGSGTTGAGGRLTLSASLPKGCYSTTVTALSAAGSRWDGATPANQLCR